MKFEIISILFFIVKLTNFKQLCTLDKGNNACFIEHLNIEEKGNINCDFDSSFSNLVLFPQERPFLDDSFDLTQSNCKYTSLDLSNFIGFSLAANLRNSQTQSTKILIRNSNFLFKFPKNKKDQLFFKLGSGSIMTLFRNVKFYSDMSPNIFSNSSINMLTIKSLVNSTLVVNYFTFDHVNNTNSSLNSEINTLRIFLFKIELSNRILEKNVFEKLESIDICNFISAIESETFKDFKNLKSVTLSPYSFKQLIHQDTKWMNSLNFYVKANYSNGYTNDPNLQLLLVIRFQRNLMNDNFTLNDNYDFPDEDFCQFVNFPHNKYVFPTLFIYQTFTSCTYLWLTQYYKYFDLEEPFEFNDELFSKCDYDAMINVCLNKTNMVIDNRIETKTFEKFYFLYDQDLEAKKMDFLLSIEVFSLVCALGILTNGLSVVVLLNKSFQRTFNHRLYKQMYYYSLVNLSICLIFLFRLTIRCIDEVTSFCIRSLIINNFFRCFMLFLTNYFVNVLKTCSNYIHVFISLERYILSSESKALFLKRFTKTSLKKIFTLLFLFSSTINLVKLFEFDFKIYYSLLKFPLIFQEYFDFKYFYVYFHLFNIFFSNFLTIFLEVLVDLLLINFTQRALYKQNKLIANSKIKLDQNNKKEKKIKIMAITSGFSLMLFHSPDLFVSIFMSLSNQLSEQLYIKSYNNTFFYLTSLSEIVYFTSYSFHLFFFVVFNHNFYLSFKQLFNIEKRK